MSVYQQFSRVSIRDHASNPNIDQLYQPLRETLSHPEMVQKHAALTPVVAQSSRVSRDYKILTANELNNIQQNVFIPNTQLYPSRNLQPVRGERFFAIDSSERIVGPAITPQEMERIRSQGFRQQQVLYQSRRQEGFPSKAAAMVVSQSNFVSNHGKSEKLKATPVFPNSQTVKQEIIYQNQPMAERYTSSANFDQYGKGGQQYKYNLFSIIDEPANNCKDFGLQGCGGCPGNQIIASKNRPLSLAVQ